MPTLTPRIPVLLRVSRLFGWGDNTFGQLGLGKQREEVVYNRRMTTCGRRSVAGVPLRCEGRGDGRDG